MKWKSPEIAPYAEYVIVLFAEKKGDFIVRESIRFKEGGGWLNPNGNSFKNQKAIGWIKWPGEFSKKGKKEMR